MKPQDVILAMFALAQESRLSLFRLLVRRGPEGFTPGEIANKLSIPAPTLSFHLKELAGAKLITSRRDGRFLYYAVNFARMNDLMAFLTDQCCSLADDCSTSCLPLTKKSTRKKKI